MSAPAQNRSIDPDDEFLLIVLAAFAIATGTVTFGGFLDPIRPYLIDWKILAAGDDIIIPLGDSGTGIGAMPLLVLGGLGAILIVMLIARSRRRRRIK